jgi:hypothetical protein
LVSNSRNPGISSKFTSYEKLTLSSLRVSNGKSARYFGPREYIRHLGLEQTLLKGMLVKFPCFGWFDTSCGLKCDPSSPKAVQCGTLYHCVNCSYLMKVLGGAWHLPSAVEVLTRTIVKATNAMLFGERCILHNWSAPSHVNCSEQCPLAPKLPEHAQEELGRFASADLKQHVLLYHKRDGDPNWVN